MWYIIHTVGYYSVIKKKLLISTILKNLKTILKESDAPPKKNLNIL